jgi:hypothetical protein
VRWLGNPERGYGGVATLRAVEEGDVVVRVPRSAMLTAEEARFCRSVGRAARKLTEWQALTLKLLFERDRYQDESSLGGSVWVRLALSTTLACSQNTVHNVSSQANTVQLTGSPRNQSAARE